MISLVKRYWWALALILIGVSIGVFIIQSKNSADNDRVTLIIAPHFDDAVLPLGGLLAQEKNQRIVATFFTSAPEKIVKTSWDTASGFSDSTNVQGIRIQENVEAMKIFGDVTITNFNYIDSQYGRDEDDATLQTEISKDIQTLLVGIGDKKVKVYGPAYFNDAINHADHALVHKAFIDVARSFPNDNIEFFVYEDYPYIERFNREVVFSLQKNLENETGLVVAKVEIPLTRSQVSEKIEALTAYKTQVKAFESNKFDVITASKNYTENRCGSTNERQACEVVYKIFKY